MAECLDCGHKNRPDARFCDRCGTELLTACPACGTANDPGARFCRQCGGQLSPAAPGQPGSVSGEAVAAPPVSLASGRYLVSRLLGEGARKKVYLAQDSLLDRSVAVAQIKNEGLDEPGRTRIRRETQAMARLGDHPNIVTIHDVFEEYGNIYIVSQFMAGGSLEELLAQAEGHRLSIEQSLKIGQQIASALAHAHSRGVVHRDLKPANIWLAEDGTAKLGDFGLAVALDQSRLTSEGMIVGTVSYIAPEQALGNPPDARSDLYGLGVIVYEMLAGRPPFLGDDAVTVISQHISTAPVGLGWHNKEVPPTLESLVMRLLSKEAEDRPSSAADALAALDAISRRGPEPEIVQGVGANPLDRLAAGVFVGREKEMEELKGYVDDALSGRPKLVMLVGEPGIGKTRITEEVSTYARMRNAQVLLGRCYETEGAPSYWPWIQLIRSYVHERPAETLTSEMGPGAGNIAQVVSEVAEKLPGLPQPPDLDPEQARFRLFDSVAVFLRNASNNKPIVIVIDDLHWADKPSLLLLQFLARELGTTRLLTLGTYRDVELGRHHPLAQMLSELAGEHAVTRITLRGLEEEDVARFVELTTGTKPEPSLVQSVHRETEGNPFFVAETVRLLTSEGKLTKSAEGSWSVTIPQGVREVLGRRLNRLSADANSMLSVASVVGRDFGLNVLQRVTGMEKDTLLNALEEAIDARVISESEGIGRYRFSHALVRETLYEDLSTTRRLRLHAGVAEALESLHAGHLDRHLPQLAHHLFEASAAGEVDKAIQYNRLAAERALSLTAYEEAVQLYDRALQVFELKQEPDNTLLCDLLLNLGRAQTSAGETANARESFARAADLAAALEDSGRLAQAALDAGDVWVSAGWFEEQLIALLERALAMQPEGDSPYRALLTGRLGEALRFTSEPEKEAHLSAEALEMARRLDDPQVLAKTLYWRFVASGRPEDREERRKVSEDLLRVSQSIGDVRSRLLALRNLTFVSMEYGDQTAARNYVDDYDRLSKEIRLPLYLWFTPLLKCAQALGDGRLTEAESLLRLALRLGREANDPNVEVFTWSCALMLRRYQGNLDDIESFLPPRASARDFLWIRTGRYLLHLLRGEREEAAGGLRRMASEGFSVVPKDWGRLWFLYDLAEIACGVEDRAAARTLYAMFKPYEDHYTTTFPGVTRGPVPHALAMLEWTLENFDNAEANFIKAQKMARDHGARPVRAIVQFDYARMLIARNRPGDRQAALELAGAALVSAREIGMGQLVKDLVEMKLSIQGAVHEPVTGSLHAVASALDEEKPDLRVHASVDGTVTLLFSDIEESTALNEKLGDAKWLEILRRHNSIVRREVAAHRGDEVKNYGDGFMLAFPSARLALLCAIAVQRAFDDYNRSGPEVPIKVRMGLHTGEAVREAGDFFGRDVNLAARVAGQAVGGQVLVSAITRDLVSGSTDLRFGQSREVPLKGLSQPQKLYEVVW